MFWIVDQCQSDWHDFQQTCPYLVRCSCNILTAVYSIEVFNAEHALVVAVTSPMAETLQATPKEHISIKQRTKVQLAPPDHMCVDKSGCVQIVNKLTTPVRHERNDAWK